MSAEGLEDCIAMAEDGFSWFAFPKTMKRGRVMAKLARNAEITGWDWPYVIKAYRIRSGHVQESDNRYGWWSECPAEEPGAVPAWIVRLRGVS